MADQDAQHLKLLVIFHYVVAGISALVGCFPVIHLAIGISMLSGRLPSHSSDPGGEKFMGWMFTGMAGSMIVVMWSFAILVLCAAHFLRQRRRRTFCLVVAGLECMMMPYGTILGVFTIIVLLRPSVCRLFGEASS